MSSSTSVCPLPITNFRTKLAFTALGLILSTLLRAESTVAEFESGEVVVTGRNSGVESVTNTKVVTAEEIRQRGARTLDEAVALLPGVIVRTGADGTPRIQLRGLQSRHVKLLLNGIPLNSSFDGNFDPTLIPVEQIAKIKLSSGSSSMLYGDGDLGGAINIITRKGTGDPALTSAGIEAGQSQHRRGWASAGGAAGPLDFFVSATRLQRDGFRVSDDFAATPLEDGGLRTNSDSRRTSFYANLGLAATENLKLGLTASHTEGEQGIPPSTLNSATDAFATRTKYERLENIRSETVRFNAELAGSGPWSARGWVYYNGDRENDNSFDNASLNTVGDARLNNTFLLQNNTRINGGHAEVIYQTGLQGSLTMALDDRKEHWTQNGILHDVAVTGNGSGNGGRNGSGGGTGNAANGNFTTRAINAGKQVGISSAALEYSFSPVKNADFTAGAGHYRQDKDGGADQSANGYLLGAGYAFDPSTRARASVSQHVRFPTIAQLYDAVSGDANLKRESARNKEIGLTHRLAENTSLTATVFRNDVYNYIEKDDATNRFRNFDHYRFTGAELQGDTVVLAGLKLRGIYSYLRSKNLSAGSPRRFAIPPQPQTQPGSPV